MNISHRKRSSDEKQAEKVLRSLLERAAGFSGWQVSDNPAEFDRAFDFLATGQTPGGVTIELWVEFHSDPRPSLFPYVNVEKEFHDGKVKTARARVFAAPYISERMAEICWDHGWSWYDLAGNCRLSIPGTPLYIERSGQPPVHERPPARVNLGTPEAARVVRALLAPENAGIRWTQREIQLHCQPNLSLGLVNKVIRHLRDEAFLSDAPDGGFHLRDALGVLEAWRLAYRFDRHEQRNYFTLLTGPRLQEALANLDALTGGHAAYAAFSAANWQAPHVRQPKTWLYVGGEWEDKIGEIAEAKIVDSGENLVVIIPEDHGVFYLRDGGTAGERRLDCTNPVQTYVDLAHQPGRGEEAAQAILEQVLKPAWKAKGLL